MTSDQPTESTNTAGADSATPGPVLVAVDFSEDSRAAVIWASRQAEITGCRLLVFHVVHDPAVSPGFYRRLSEDWLRPMADLAEEMMASYMKEMRAEHHDLPALASAEARLVTGLPASRIIDFAKAVSASLIVIGSKGRTGLQHILLGSVAERVVQLAPMPVVVVKGP